MPESLNGIAVIDKPAGWTSHDVVAKSRGVLGTRKIGHSGTLDPDATGVLVLGVGRATRLLRFITSLSKSYEAEIVLGVETDTLDASGAIIARHDMTAVTATQVQSVTAALTGNIMQKPPMVSAVKVGGRRLHELARAGVEVERAERPVTVYRFDAEPMPVEQVARSMPVGESYPNSTPYRPPTPVEQVARSTPVEQVARSTPVEQVAREYSVWRAWVNCSSGTYVRVLAADLGRALGGGAHLRRLRRTAVGHFTLADAHPVESPHVLPMASAVRNLCSVRVKPAVEAEVRHGRVLSLERLGISASGVGLAVQSPTNQSVSGVGLATDDQHTDLWAVHDAQGALLAVYKPCHQGAKPVVVVSG